MICRVVMRITERSKHYYWVHENDVLFSFPSWITTNQSGSTALNYKLHSRPAYIMFIFIVFFSTVISENVGYATQKDLSKLSDPFSMKYNEFTISNSLSHISNLNANSLTNLNGNSNSLSNSKVFKSKNIKSKDSTQFAAKTNSNMLTTTYTSTTTFADFVQNTTEVMEDTPSGPYFDKAASKNVTASLGKTAYLNCRVKNLGNRTMLLQVSWVRHRDIHLLTVGRYTYTSDQRFRAIHQPQSEDWTLQIKYPQHRDSGIYECQVSTIPHISHYIHLNVVEPATEIVGGPDLFIESGSTINLTCVVLNSPEPPAYIFWNHNDVIINYDSFRGGVSVVTNKGTITTSFLLIKSARSTDSGQYQCNPSNSKPKIATVHVLNGEFPAAMQRANMSLQRMSHASYLCFYLFLYTCTTAVIKRCLRYPTRGGRAAA